MGLGVEACSGNWQLSSNGPSTWGYLKNREREKKTQHSAEAPKPRCPDSARAQGTRGVALDWACHGRRPRNIVAAKGQGTTLCSEWEGVSDGGQGTRGGEGVWEVRGGGVEWGRGQGSEEGDGEPADKEEGDGRLGPTRPALAPRLCLSLSPCLACAPSISGKMKSRMRYIIGAPGERKARRPVAFGWPCPSRGPGRSNPLPALFCGVVVVIGTTSGPSQRVRTSPLRYLA